MRPGRVAALSVGALAWTLVCGQPVASHAVGPGGEPVAPRVATAPARNATLTMQAHETLAAALLRAGLTPDQADRVAVALSNDVDTVNPHDGLRLDIKLSATGGRLMSLQLAPRPETRLTLDAGPGDTLRLRRADTSVHTAPVLVQGVVDGSLYLSMVDAGVAPETASKVVNLFGRRLDLTRDIRSGDRFRLVFEERFGADGEPLGEPGLLYAETSARGGLTKLYRSGVGGDFVDGDGSAARVLLLRTPVDGARVSSTFGMRLHPILGFSRMHQGIDFAVGAGAPVLAAGDGVVEEARWSGGYGRWLKIRHAAGLETGYGHLLAWASGIAPGAAVRQGQVVGFVGDSGLATGPHLHYEVLRSGVQVDPRAATGVSTADLGESRLNSAARARMAAIDATVASVTAG